MNVLKTVLAATTALWVLPALAADTITVTDAYARFMPGAMAGAGGGTTRAAVSKRRLRLRSALHLGPPLRPTVNCRPSTSTYTAARCPCATSLSGASRSTCDGSSSIRARGASGSVTGTADSSAWV